MKKEFGEALKDLMRQTGLKEKDLANHINYDITSISKWVNGAKLPSSRNGEEIIAALSDCFAQNGMERLETGKILERLQIAWKTDMLYQEMAVRSQESLSFVDDRKDFFELLRKVFCRIAAVNEGHIEIRATFDVLKLLGRRFYELLQELPSLGMRSVHLKMCMDMEEAGKDYRMYCETLLNTVSGYEDAEITIVQEEKDTPWILMAGEYLYVQLLYPSRDDFAACFSMDKKITERFGFLCGEILEKGDKILTCASPENLRRTNVQLDSYSSSRQRLFFNEAPAMLLPPGVMDDLIQGSENKSYKEYLRKLKRVFREYTFRAHVDLVLFSSVISDYVMTGELSLGNVAHHLTREQVSAHINYMAQCLEENPDFHLFVMKDTTSVLDGFRRPPSIFIDNNAVTIENSQRKPNENYHISMYPQLMSMFGEYFDDIKGKPNCVELSAMELRRYL